MPKIAAKMPGLNVVYTSLRISKIIVD
jgi:hypothetical protein